MTNKPYFNDGGIKKNNVDDERNAKCDDVRARMCKRENSHFFCLFIRSPAFVFQVGRVVLSLSSLFFSSVDVR
jgi:hypothetical protein